MGMIWVLLYKTEKNSLKILTTTEKVEIFGHYDALGIYLSLSDVWVSLWNGLDIDFFFFKSS